MVKIDVWYDDKGFGVNISNFDYTWFTFIGSIVAARGYARMIRWYIHYWAEQNEYYGKI